MTKLDSDLLFLQKLLSFCEEKKWRLILYGGYGLDFALGKITRKHRDVDAVIYGTTDREEATKKITNFLFQILTEPIIKTKGRDFFMELDVSCADFAANLYYVQTVVSPRKNLNQIYHQSGKVIINSKENFPDPVQGKLANFSIEVQDQQDHLAEILVKQKSKSDELKYKQDITLLREMNGANG